MRDDETAPAYTRRHWAKSDRQDHWRIHLLEHHLADVSACFEALLKQPTIYQRLARTAGRDDLDPTTVARLCVFAALHDIGKVNVGFQAQIWRREDFPGGHRPASFRRVGHTLDITPVLNGDDQATGDWFFDSLGWWEDAISWDNDEGKTVCALLIAALSHHGRPLQLYGSRSRNSEIWQSFNSLSPKGCVQRVGRLIREWFPQAFIPDSAPIPDAAAFQHMFLGLCNLADWIGSNENWFKFVDAPQDDYIATARDKANQSIKAVGLDLTEQRWRFAGAPGFDVLFPHVDGQDNAIQRAAAQDTPLDQRLVIIESETGSGKTEASLWRFARMYEAELVDGIYFALPTRASAVQIHERVRQFIGNLFPELPRPPVVLAVPGYESDQDCIESGLQDYDASWNGDNHRETPWASESPKRFLAAQIAVGTVDQAMLGALKVKNAHLRTACLARNLLVVDEVHASDTYMRRVLKSLLDVHLGAGGYALLMSATLGSRARRQWLSNRRLSPDDGLSLNDAIKAPYPAVSVMASSSAAFGGEIITAAGENDREKTVNITARPDMQDFGQVAQLGLAAARAGAKVLVVRNTVGHALATMEAMELAASDGELGLLFACQDKPTLHHSRFAPGDRRLLDREVEARLGKERRPGGVVVVGTQTLEQSLDIDADLLITDLCPVDVLLQRIGRLHRHREHDRPDGYVAPACIVLTPQDENLSLLLKSPVNGLGRYVYEDLRVLEATRRLIIEHRQWSIPRMNRELVERATHPDALDTITQELGEAWQEHAVRVTGDKFAEGLTAGTAIINWDLSFFADNRDVLFGSAEEKIRTRLGDEGIELKFDPPPPSPFVPGRTIDRMTVPFRWLAETAVDSPVVPALIEEGFTFSIGARSFRYDRLGLHPM